MSDAGTEWTKLRPGVVGADLSVFESGPVSFTSDSRLPGKDLDKDTDGDHALLLRA